MISATLVKQFFIKIDDLSMHVDLLVGQLEPQALQQFGLRFVELDGMKTFGNAASHGFCLPKNKAAASLLRPKTSDSPARPQTAGNLRPRGGFVTKVKIGCMTGPSQLRHLSAVMRD